MKKHFLIGFALMAALSLFSCSKDEPNDKPGSGMKFAGGGTSLTLNIKAEGESSNVGFHADANWKVSPQTSLPPGFVIMPASGSAGDCSVKITVPANTQPDEASYVIDITATGGGKITLTVKQEAAPPEPLPPFYFVDGENKIPDMSRNIPAKDTSFTVQFHSDSDWKIVVDNIGSASPTEGKAGDCSVEISIPENTVTEPRTTTFGFFNTTETSSAPMGKLTVEQKEAADIFYFSDFHKNNVGTQYTLEVKWDDEGNWPLYNVKSNLFWYVETEGDGAVINITEKQGSTGLRATITANDKNEPRTTVFTFKNKKDNTVLGSITISQEAKPQEVKISVFGKSGELDPIYTWFGNSVKFPVTTEPETDIATLKFNDHLFRPGEDAVFKGYVEGNWVHITSDLKGEVNDDNTISGNMNKGYATYRIECPVKPENFVTGIIYYKTVCGISYKSGSEQGTLWILQYTEGGRDNWAYTWNGGDVEKYFTAYYAKNAEEFEYNPLVVPEMYFPDSYIPTSEYTLTSSKPDVLEVTKDDNKNYKLTVKKKQFEKIVLTYKCGNAVQKFFIKLAF